uniref:Uncharacterized protein n=1 Tax=Oryza nivara TaxID=4536 RepID=A0A0E0I221_ORYNI
MLNACLFFGKEGLESKEQKKFIHGVNLPCIFFRARPHCGKQSTHGRPNHCTHSQEKQVDQKVFSQNVSKGMSIIVLLIDGSIKFIFKASPPTLVANRQTRRIKRSHWARSKN